jgi:hypothetical protein
MISGLLDVQLNMYTYIHIILPTSSTCTAVVVIHIGMIANTSFECIFILLLSLVPIVILTYNYTFDRADHIIYCVPTCYRRQSFYYVFLRISIVATI